MIYDTNKMQHITSENNDVYSSDVEQRIRRFKERLKYEIEEVFKYYHVMVHPSSIDNMVENFDAIIKNNLGYKKIMIMMNDAIGNVRNSSQYANQILADCFSEQKQANNRMDMMETYMELSHRFRNLEIDQRIIEELLSLIKKSLFTLQDEVQDLTDQYIRNNEKQLSALGQEFTGDNINNKQDNINDMSQRFILAINKLDEQKAIEFLENEFSMLDNKQITNIITNIISQLPFGSIELEEYLRNEQQRINSLNNSLNELENLLK